MLFALQYNDVLDGNIILALNQAAWIVPSRYVMETDIVRQGAEERNTGANEHGNARNNETLNKPGLEKPLNGDPAIHISMPDAASIKLRHDFSGIPRHMFY